MCWVMLCGSDAAQAGGIACFGRPEAEAKAGLRQGWGQTGEAVEHSPVAPPASWLLPWTLCHRRN